MSHQEILNYAAAALASRIILGLLFFFQGYDKVFRVKVINVVEAFNFSEGSTSLPKMLVYPAALYTSLVEFICGTLLIIGLLKYLCLYLLAADLIIVSLGMSIKEPLWNTKNVLPRLVLVLFLLLMPAGWDMLTLDHLFSINLF